MFDGLAGGGPKDVTGCAGGTLTRTPLLCGMALTGTGNQFSGPTSESQRRTSSDGTDTLEQSRCFGGSSKGASSQDAFERQPSSAEAGASYHHILPKVVETSTGELSGVESHALIECPQYMLRSILMGRASPFEHRFSNIWETVISVLRQEQRRGRGHGGLDHRRAVQEQAASLS